HEQVPEGGTIQTEADTNVELLLKPGLFLRLGQNTKVILNSLNPDIHIRLMQGDVLIDSLAWQSLRPIRVEGGSFDLSIATAGIHRFSGAQGVRSNDAPFMKTDELSAWSRQRSAAQAFAAYQISG